MKKALKTKVRGLSKGQFKRLKELSYHAKNLYNQSLWTLLEAFEATGNYFSYPKMDKAMKQVTNLEEEINYKLLKAKVAQQTLRRLDKNFKSFFSSHKDYLKHSDKYKGKPKPPKYKSGKQDNLIYDFQAFQIKTLIATEETSKINLLNCMFYKGDFVKCRRVAVLEKNLEIQIPNSLWDKKIKQIEIIPKPHYFQAVFVYQENQDALTQVTSNGNVMSIDLGLNNLATCVTNGVIKPFIIDGKRLKSINYYYNKRKAKIQSDLEKNHGRKWSKRLQNLTDWRNARVKDYLHKVTASVAKTCIDYKISKVVVGDVTKSLNHINLGKKTNQNFVNLSLGQFITLLSYKLEQHGIKLIVANEAYTSKASFIDSDLMPKKYDKDAKPIYSGKRVKRGLYKSRNDTKLNADANAAYNILRKYDSSFCFKELAKSISGAINAWLHPNKKILITFASKTICYK